MKVTTCLLNDVFQTAEQMRRLTETYWSDLGGWLDVPFLIFFDFVCALPYISDPIDVETVSRPKFTLDPKYMPRDCDDKAVLIASWWYGHGVPVRFMASSTRRNKTLHHTFIQLVNGLILDATYPEYTNMLGNYPYFSRLTKLQPLTKFF